VYNVRYYKMKHRTGTHVGLRFKNKILSIRTDRTVILCIILSSACRCNGWRTRNT